MSRSFEINRISLKFFPSSKLGRLCVISSFFSILAIVLSVAMAMRVFILRGISYNVPLRGASTTTKIRLVTRFVSIDASAGALTVDWYPRPSSCQNTNHVVNIYFDPNLLDMSGAGATSKVASDKPPDQPIFQFNTTTWCHPTLRDSLSTFRTVVKLTGDWESQSRWTGPSLQWYPWDRYFAEFSLFALLNSTNANVGMITAASIGSPVNFNVELDQTESINTDMGLYLRFKVKRSVAVQLLVTIIVFANWLATIAFLWITVASLLWTEEVVKEMFVIPIAALYGFTSVRSNMPGAPEGFGALIDFIGILPNLTAMAIFSATLLLIILFRRTRSRLESERHKEDESRLGRATSNEALNTEIANRLLTLVQEMMSRNTMPSKAPINNTESGHQLAGVLLPSHIAGVNSSYLTPDSEQDQIPSVIPASGVSK